MPSIFSNSFYVTLNLLIFKKLKLKRIILKNKPILIVNIELRNMDIKKKMTNIPVYKGSIIDIIFNPTLKFETAKIKQYRSLYMHLKYHEKNNPRRKKIYLFK